MIRKRYGVTNWHIDVCIDVEWIEVCEAGNEEEADGIIEILTNWAVSMAIP